MNEHQRLQELNSYNILDTPEEAFFDDLVELASLIFNTPISLITLIDENREFYKAVKGLQAKGNSRTNSFCQHTFQKPESVLTVEDTLKDPRFKNNPLVHGDPKIRFYAGAPLVTPNGNVLGTLCVIDTVPRKSSIEQENALKILAKKAMDRMNIRKRFSIRDQETSSYIKEILELTDELPGVIYQFRMNSEGKMSFDFFSKGVIQMFPGINPEEIIENALLITENIYEEDVPMLLESIQASFESLEPWESQFRVLRKDGNFEWRMGKSKPRQQEDGSVVWCGFFHDITEFKEHEKKMKQIAFDISHVIRKPVTTLLGLTALIEEDELTESDMKDYINYIKTVCEELDKLTLEMDEAYQQH